jgi:hypothetical protein
LLLLFSQAHADGVSGGGSGVTGGVSSGIGEGSGLSGGAILNGINLAPLTILNTTPIGVTTITATLVGAHTGTAVWEISDPSGTFTINSSTGVLSVANTSALTPGNTLPVVITVTGVSPTVPPGSYTITVVSVCTNTFDFSNACNSQYLGGL